ncbi:MAG: DUF501 domain-containing protein [Actinomycetota bacterium]|nr:DUF501 domain-containing protein [Actinomycetota bacterium]
MRPSDWSIPTAEDIDRLSILLDRPPIGEFVVVRRRVDGDIALISTFPIIGDDKPMPTLFWLVDPTLVRTISTLESRGIITWVRQNVPLEEMEESHRRYRTLRDSLIPPTYEGPRPYGGVAGTRIGFKCLHAHMAWHLAGGDDPIVNKVLAEFPSLNDALVGMAPATLPPSLLLSKD